VRAAFATATGVRTLAGALAARALRYCGRVTCAKFLLVLLHLARAARHTV